MLDQGSPWGIDALEPCELLLIVTRSLLGTPRRESEVLFQQEKCQYMRRACCGTSATYVRANTSAPGRLAVNTSVRAQAAVREACPQVAVVLAASEDLVSLDNGVTSLEETRAARLELHAVKNELNDERVAVLGYQGLLVASSVVLLRAVEVTSRDRTVSGRGRREQALRETVLRDEAVRNDPQHFSPDFTDGVDTPVAGLVEGLVGGRVVSLILWSIIRSRQLRISIELTKE